jgi:hypothetical protein
MGVKKKNPLVKDTQNKDQPEKTRYDEFKDFKGKKYTGMKIGRSHSWHYYKGDWKEKKETPDLWEFNYNVNKHRAGHSP